MAQSDTFDLQPATSRKRLRSLIDPDGIRDGQRRKDNTEAFGAILQLYIDNKTIFPIRSLMGDLDGTNPASARRWTPDTACIIADVELAVESALKNEQRLLDLFWKWFVLPEIEIVTYEKLSAQDSKLHGQIAQRCGREFLRRGIYPINKYFRLPQRNTRPSSTLRSQ
jgi:hypothetical protein